MTTRERFRRVMAGDAAVDRLARHRMGLLVG